MAAVSDRLAEIRRRFHRFPEPAWREFRTTVALVEEIRDIGVDELAIGPEAYDPADRMAVPDEHDLGAWRERAATAGVDDELLAAMVGGTTGVVAVLRRGAGPSVGLRVDIDGLLIEESTDPDHHPAAAGFRSETEGTMHACGHDGHMTIGLGVLEAIKESDFEGTLTVFFQPAEEESGGGKPMAESRFAADLEYLFAVHLGLDHPTGEVVAGIEKPLAMSHLTAEFAGTSAHAGKSPQEGDNAMQAIATAIQNAYAIPRHGDGMTRVNVGRAEAGTASNVIAERAALWGEIRGAYNRMARLPPEARSNGVAASSAGNHAQGVALAGRLLDIETTIVVPTITPAAKIEATRGYGAEVIVEGDVYERSYERALELAEDGDREFIHPFNDGAIIAGQGTVGLELLEQLPNLDVVVVPIGGGLIPGVATALKAHDPGVRVVGVQPEGAAHAKPSLERGEIHRLADVDTVAEGIADARLLEKTFAVARERVDDVVSVSDVELSAAVALLAERAKVIAEAAGAAPVAALLSGTVAVDGDIVAAIVSGGNVNVTEHAELTRIGLMDLGRYARVGLELADWPAGIGAVTRAIEDGGAELDEFRRARRTHEDTPNRTPVRLCIEGSGREHLRTVIAALEGTDGIAVTGHSLD